MGEVASHVLHLYVINHRPYYVTNILKKNMQLFTELQREVVCGICQVVQDLINTNLTRVEGELHFLLQARLDASGSF